jgi:hypothetical protein
VHARNGARLARGGGNLAEREEGSWRVGKDPPGLAAKEKNLICKLIEKAQAEQIE